MASWQRIVIALVFLFVLARCASVEKARGKKRRDRGKGKNLPKDRETLETLQQLCRRNGSGSSRKNILELQAFFDLTKVRTIKTVNLFSAKLDLTIGVFCLRIMKLRCVQFLFFWTFLVVCLLEGGNVFKGSRLLCGRYPRSGALKSQQLRSVESALQWTTG